MRKERERMCRFAPEAAQKTEGGQGGGRKGRKGRGGGLEGGREGGSGVLAAKNVPERRRALDALGFDWGDEEAYVDLRWDVFLGTYYYWRLIKGVPLVPWEFIVPEEAPWPFFCRGVELGKMCDMIRRHQEVFFQYYPERVQTLEYFGWKWWWPSMEEGEEPEAPQAYNRYDNFQGMDLVLKLNVGSSLP
ncbi:hypothetical protein NSK_006352, partial [Nannochloropsis salina CCMP1776]